MPTGDATDAMMIGFRQMDSDGNGRVDYGEYLKHSSGGFGVDAGSELDSAMRMGFDMQDSNRDGEISEDEFRMMMGMTAGGATPAMPAMPAMPPSVCQCDYPNTGACNDACINPNPKAEEECRNMGFKNCEGYCLADMGLKSATECAKPAMPAGGDWGTAGGDWGTATGGCKPGEPCSMPMLGPDGMPPMEE